MFQTTNQFCIAIWLFDLLHQSRPLQLFCAVTQEHDLSWWHQRLESKTDLSWLARAENASQQQFLLVSLLDCASLDLNQTHMACLRRMRLFRCCWLPQEGMRTCPWKFAWIQQQLENSRFLLKLNTGYWEWCTASERTHFLSHHQLPKEQTQNGPLRCLWFQLVWTAGLQGNESRGGLSRENIIPSFHPSETSIPFEVGCISP